MVTCGNEQTASLFTPAGRPEALSEGGQHGEEADGETVRRLLFRGKAVRVLQPGGLRLLAGEELRHPRGAGVGPPPGPQGPGDGGPHRAGQGLRARGASAPPGPGGPRGGVLLLGVHRPTHQSHSLPNMLWKILESSRFRFQLLELFARWCAMHRNSGFSDQSSHSHDQRLLSGFKAKYNQCKSV